MAGLKYCKTVLIQVGTVFSFLSLPLEREIPQGSFLESLD